MTATETAEARPKVEAIRHHYEIGNEFFQLVLGEASFTYSAGFWAAGDDDHADLARAQERKLDCFADLAGMRPGARLLDIGCGWGSALQRAVEVHGAERAVGLTLSRTAAEWITALDEPRIEARVESWEDHRPDAPYDGIVCVNAIEHFVRNGLPAKEKVRRYREFFRRCRDMLSPDGRLVVHAISSGRTPRQRDVLRDMMTVVREEFEGSHIPTLPELASASQGLFELTELHNDRLDCSRTMRVWAERLRRHRDRAIELEGVEVVDRFERYLDVCSRMFGEGYFNDYRLAFTALP